MMLSNTDSFYLLLAFATNSVRVGNDVIRIVIVPLVNFIKTYTPYHRSVNGGISKHLFLVQSCQCSPPNVNSLLQRFKLCVVYQSVNNGTDYHNI